MRSTGTSLYWRRTLAALPMITENGGAPSMTFCVPAELSCDSKVRRLATALVDAKKRLNTAGVRNFKFVLSGHTDSSGSATHNKDLSAKRAAVIEKELIARGIPQVELESVGLGSERRLVSPDNTPAKKARNRRYEIQVKL